jgi:GNAT superfamily N-acetyltransferase
MDTETGSDNAGDPASAGLVIDALGPADLAAANVVVTQAIDSWPLSPRVKRLVLPSYHYQAHDLDHLRLLGARLHGQLVGLVAFENAKPADVPDGRSGLQVHGLFVDPAHHGRGIGSRLFARARDAAIEQGLDGVLVKAERQARGFFARQGMRELPVRNPEKDYPHRFWLDCA